MKIHTLLFPLIFFLLAALSGCGQKGDLYLPDDAQRKEAQVPADIPEKAASH